MNTTTHLNTRITQLAVGRHLPHRTVRIRLTLLYGGLFLLSGAALVAITYVLFQQATEYTKPHLPNIPHTPAIQQPKLPQLPQFLPQLAHDQYQLTHYPQQLAHDQLPLSHRPRPGSHIPYLSSHSTSISSHITSISSRRRESARRSRASGSPDRSVQTAQPAPTRTSFCSSGIASPIMAVLAVLAGWLVAGRVMQPLEDSYRAQRQFVANASHELRAPLTRQRALIEVALASPKANVASLRNAHERVLASEQHLEQLIDSLLALTRGQAGLERRERSDFAVLATRALEAQHSEVERLSLDVDATLDPAPTTGDPRLLERVIANLIDNAIRHNTHGGHVEITTGTRDRHAFVSIENTGPTVPPEQIQRLFQPFQRLVDARTQHNNGHGLGLSIVKAIANAHRAELAARARPGGGLAIELSFPPASGAGSRMTLAARTKRGSPHAGVPPA